MRIAITGTTGLFGNGLWQVIGRSHDVIPLPHAALELTDRAAVQSKLRGAKPDVLIHPAGLPDIDICETDHAKCWHANVDATRNLCDAADSVGFGLAFISTDAVFDGKKSTPYIETDPVNPASYYGESKVAAEQLVRSLPKHWIFRVSVLFGPGKTNFVEKTFRTLQADGKIIVAADQMGSATYTLDAAEKILELIESGPTGLFHLSNHGACSRYELAVEAARLAGLGPTKVIGKALADMKRAGPRLKYSVMEMAALKRAGIAEPRRWKHALAEYVATLCER